MNLTSFLGYLVNPTNKTLWRASSPRPVVVPKKPQLLLGHWEHRVQPWWGSDARQRAKHLPIWHPCLQARDSCYRKDANLKQASSHLPISTEVMLISRRRLALASSFSRGGWRRLAACCCQDTEHGHGSINGSQPERMQEIKHLFSRYQGFIGEYCSWMLSKDRLQLNGSNSVSQWKHHLLL